MKKTVLFLAIAALFCFTVKAQAQSSLHSYVKDSDTMEYIGSLAHPAQDVLDVQYVNGTSSYIDIKIKFGSLMRNYWEPYRINLKHSNGITYAYSIVRTRAVSIYDPFIALKITRDIMNGVANYMGYESANNEAMRALYGVSESELTKEQLAAILLMNYCYGEDD